MLTRSWFQGTWQSKPGEVREAVQHALEIGYRHVDAAYCYGNEAEVGEGIRQAILSGKVRREDIFVTTKLWCTYHTKVEENLDLSLKALGLDYVDLYLMHWPIAMNPKGEYAYKLPNPTAGFSCNNRLYCWFSQYLLNTLKTLGNDDKFPTRPDGSRDIVLERSHIDTYKDMEKLIALGKARAIGVANYSLRFLKELLPSVSVVPAVNQIENHPQLPQQEIVDYCELHGIHITAYSPLGSTGSPLIKLPVIQSIAQKKSTTPAVVLLSWHGTLLSPFYHIS